jgi:hypothetical protein
MINKEIDSRIKEFLGLNRKDLVERGKDLIFFIMNALKKWLVNEEDVENKTIVFLLRALGTFIFADGELQNEEYEFFLDIMNSRDSGMSRTTLEKILKKSPKEYLSDVLMLNELIDNLGNHQDEEISIIKQTLCSLGIIFCSLDGNVTTEEAKLIEYYLED